LNGKICLRLCLWPWLGPPRAVLQYIVQVYFRFCGWRLVFLY